MPIRRRLLLATAALPPAAARRAAAQGAAQPGSDWPNRPVTVVVPWPPGGSTDVMVRILVQRLSADLGQPFVVDNRPGATGTVGHAWVARQRPDGYTLLAGTNSTYAIAPHLYASLPYDNDRAFTPITQLATNPQMLCVHPSLPVNTFAEFLAYARARPGELTFGTSGLGGTSHLATELLMSMAGIEMLHVPYRGGGPAAQAILAGETKVTFVDAITALPFLRAGQLRALGVSTAQRTPLAPEVPTLAEAGLPGYQSSTDFGLFAPAGLPDPLLRRIHAAVVAALRSPEVTEKLLQQGMTPVGSAPEEFAAYLRREGEKWGEIIRARNIRAP
jgi:tripartite-type tricarboxylate transporter receptor subunit TctC